jgi:hypothetical protein
VKVASQGVRPIRVAGIPYAAIRWRFASARGFSDSPGPKPPQKRALNNPGVNPTACSLVVPVDTAVERASLLYDFSTE